MNCVFYGLSHLTVQEPKYCFQAGQNDLDLNHLDAEEPECDAAGRYEGQIFDNQSC